MSHHGHNGDQIVNYEHLILNIMAMKDEMLTCKKNHVLSIDICKVIHKLEKCLTKKPEVFKKSN